MSAVQFPLIESISSAIFITTSGPLHQTRLIAFSHYREGNITMTDEDARYTNKEANNGMKKALQHGSIKANRSQQWLRYWRNSLADSESLRGALKNDDLKPAYALEHSNLRSGCLPVDSPLLAKLFEGENDNKQVVRAVIRPHVYFAPMEHGAKKTALYPEVVTPLLCGAWVARDGRLVPADPPVIPRDLLYPQADDRFTLAEVEALDRFLTKSAPSVFSETDAITLLKSSEQVDVWQSYYEISCKLFDDLCPQERLKNEFIKADEGRILKIDDHKGAARSIIELYDWLSRSDSHLPLMDCYALNQTEHYQPCAHPLTSMTTRLGHAGTQYPLAIAQRDALTQVLAMDEGEILAVNGPPGTGKTTFVLSAVASLWVKAALAETEPPLIIAASTNNQAVTNILEAFAKDFQRSDGPFGGRWLPGIDSFGGYYPAQSKQKEAEKTYQTPSFYRHTETQAYIQDAEKAFLTHAQKAFNDDSLNEVGSVKSRLHKALQSHSSIYPSPARKIVIF
ncbi:AAA domain-containing protein [Halomonas sp. LS-001]